MKSLTTTAPFLDTVKQLGSQPKTFFEADFHIAKNDSVHLLYSRDIDEPDFDCEFLRTVNSDFSENMIDLNSEEEEEQADDFNDNQWDAEIYDPYEESAYY